METRSFLTYKTAGGGLSGSQTDVEKVLNVIWIKNK